MRAAIIDENGEVVNVIMVDAAEDYPGCILCQEDVAIGWTYDGMAFAPPPVPPETEAETVARLTAAVQSYLDLTARAKGYDDIISACSYAAAPNRFQAEAQAFLSWRAEVWSLCFEIMTTVKAGAREIPATEELIAELPAVPAEIAM